MSGEEFEDNPVSEPEADGTETFNEMDMNGALLVWLATFCIQLDIPCDIKQLSDVRDGVLLLTLMKHIEQEHFRSLAMQTTGTDAAAVANIEALLTGLAAALHATTEQAPDLSYVNVHAAALGNSEENVSCWSWRQFVLHNQNFRPKSLMGSWTWSRIINKRWPS